MEKLEELKIRKRIKYLIYIVITGLVLSGITTFPIETELYFISKHLNYFPEFVREWLTKVYMAVKEVNTAYPFLSYGTDWLAFAHLIIAIVFIGPLKNPIKNIWVIEFGIITCISVFPLALIFGHLREIPFYWRLMDCSFGFFGLIPLILCRQNILKLSRVKESVGVEE